MTAAHILSTYTGSYRKFVEDNIFNQINMTSTTFSLSKVQHFDQISNAWSSFHRRRIPLWFGPEVEELVSGAGGIITNAIDMVGPWSFCLQCRKCMSSEVFIHRQIG